jgi:hypothetical protein
MFNEVMALNENDVLKIIDEIYAGNSVTSALKKHKISPKHFHQAIASTPSLEVQYERAQAARAEILAEDIVNIADTESDPQKARNMIDARKWYSSKMKPAKFGDRIDVNVTQVVDINVALTEARKRALLPMSYLDQSQTIEHAEFKQLSNDKASDSKSEATINEWDDFLNSNGVETKDRG